MLDYKPIVSAYAACNEYGMDAMSIGGTIGFAMECWQRGLIDADRVRHDYEGLELEWGNCEALLRMTGIIADRQGGLGELLADGVRAASTRLAGTEAFALHVKGMELPGYDPRGFRSMGLAYATSCRGACHLKAGIVEDDTAQQHDSSDHQNDRAAAIVEAENRRAVIDSALIGTFASSAITEEWTVRLIRAVTRTDLSCEDLAAMGRRVCELERRLAVREGISRRDDELPRRIL